jgi:flavin-binding protein dodecin
MRTRFPSGGTRNAHDRNIRSVWVQEFEAVVENGRVGQSRVNVKISFLLEEGQM